MIGLSERVEAERARRSLSLFLGLAWPLVESASLVGGFHLELICSHLERVARGELARLVINVPPRHGKSLVASVLFPAWVWASAPQTRFLYASYAAGLATRDSLRTRRLLESAWYRDRYGAEFRLTDDQNQKDRFENDRGGARLATSVGGGATGEGGDIILVDDPHKLEEADSQAKRESVIDWYTSTLATRLNNPTDGAIVLIGQRVHEHDLFGHVLEQEGWAHLCLPAEFDPDHPHLCPQDPRTLPGELLAPGRFSAAAVARLKVDLGSYGASAQLQQLPAPASGGIFDRSWWTWYDPAEPLPHFDELFQSWDLAFTGEPTSDFVVGQAWGTVGSRSYLLDQRRAQLDFPQTIGTINDFTTDLTARFPRHAGHAIYVEQAANGYAVVQSLREQVHSLIPVSPVGDKIGRAHAVSPQIEAGLVHLPGAPNAHGSSYDRARTPAWVQALVEETAAFPHGRYDDQVDAMTQALGRAARPCPRVRTLGG